MTTLNINCPVCNEEHNFITFYEHLLTNHQEFLAVLTNIRFSDIDVNNLINIYGEEYDYDYDNYENLSNLCDEIGVVEIGVDDIDISAPICIYEYDKPENCPICLDILSNTTNIRRTRNCNHKYCAECIENWFKKNKKCPVCKVEN